MTISCSSPYKSLACERQWSPNTGQTVSICRSTGPGQAVSNCRSTRKAVNICRPTGPGQAVSNCRSSRKAVNICRSSRKADNICRSTGTGLAVRWCWPIGTGATRCWSCGKGQQGQQLWSTEVGHFYTQVRRSAAYCLWNHVTDRSEGQSAAQQLRIMLALQKKVLYCTSSDVLPFITTYFSQLI